MIGVIGSILMFGYQKSELMMNGGLCFLAISLVIGFKELTNLYVKLIGVEDPTRIE